MKWLWKDDEEGCNVASPTSSHGKLAERAYWRARVYENETTRLPQYFEGK